MGQRKRMINLYPSSPRPSRGGELENYESTIGIAGDVIPQKKMMTM